MKLLWLLGTFILSIHGFIRRQHSPIIKGIQPSKTSLNGIPKLFRWLSELYPVVIEPIVGPLGVDNFYLDMNGIIHACTHSNSDELVVNDEEAMFKKIFAYTDRLYKLVRPKRLMYLAIDGVAPRAKMNQQRSRRFRSAKEREALIFEHFTREGKLPEDSSFDSNCITPGTDFMYRLGIAFRRWITFKQTNDPFWKSGAEVVFSGPDVPGEGEHKVMDMIRYEQQNAPDYLRGKFKYCLYGLDADLIMLSLVTHEPLFILLREKIKTRQSKKSVMQYAPEDFEILEVTVLRRMLKDHFRLVTNKLNQITRLKLQSTESTYAAIAQSKRQQEDNAKLLKDVTNRKTFTDETIEINELIDARTGEYRKTVFELQRVVDDFVFMCFFVGNDFLPGLPHLDIADGALNMMMNIYRDQVPNVGGYLSDKTKLHLPRFELFVQEIARKEALYFQQRAVDENDSEYAGPNYKDHYYKEKFGIEPGDVKARRQVVQSYVEGLIWVLNYYHSGCKSWTWYYPYLYAPLASDLVDIPDLTIQFPAGVPFTPLLQLLSVLPPQSGDFLPKSYADIMTNPISELTPFYPRDFEVDANGKKNSWESIVKIPFIEEQTLVDAVSQIDHAMNLTVMERARNIRGTEERFTPPNFRRLQNGTKTEPELIGRWGNALADERPTYNNNYNNQYGKSSNNNNNNRGYSSSGGSGKPYYKPAFTKNNSKYGNK